MYTDEINVLIIISLLKQHNIRNVIVSPGTTNASFVLSIQHDSWFNVYSAVDERAAAFMACGLVEETGEPVVISCTGATASRNYIPGLTEAFYKNLPVLALTSSQSLERRDTYNAQFMDRASQLLDMVKHSFNLTSTITNQNIEIMITNTNKAILELFSYPKGPVHINLETINTFKFPNKELPKFRKIERFVTNEEAPSMMPYKKIGVFIGAHQPFTLKEEYLIDSFCGEFDGIVLCDHTSNYHGQYSVLVPLINFQEKELLTRKFDLIIYIGSVSGSYLPVSANEVWRVDEDGVVRDYLGNLTKVFGMSISTFFDMFKQQNIKKSAFLQEAELEYKRIYNLIPELPFSNLWIAKTTAPKLPEKSVLHLAILNSLRAWNYFELNKTINCYSNTGGFGIDGCFSSFVGAAKANPTQQFYGVFGDLSFFYDINGLELIPSNCHILVINNGIGTEFKNYSHPASSFGDVANEFIAAGGHNGNKSTSLLKDICKIHGIAYQSSMSKEDYLFNEKVWLEYSGAPVIHEVFTNDSEESAALDIINHLENDSSLRLKKGIKKSFIFKILRKIRG